MKKELVIIAGSCYPNCSATGAIALKYADYLINVFNVRLIAIQEGNEKAYNLRFRNVSVYTLTQWRLRAAQISHDNARNARGIQRAFYHFFYTFLRIIGRLQSFLFFPDNCWWYQRKAFSLLERLNTDKKIDVILSFSAPIESHFAARRYKLLHPSVRWVSYWGDLYSSSEFKLNIFSTIEKLKATEKMLIQESDCALMTEEVHDILYSRYKDVLQTPLIRIPYTLDRHALQRQNSSQINKVDSISFIYMGSFYRHLRNPEYMLKLFTFKDHTDFILHLYSQGDCDDIVKKYTELSDGHIIDHGIVSPAELDYALQEADILINIENLIKTSRPSKLLQLMSYRKPIVDFCYSGYHSPLLKLYPLVTEIEIGNDLEESYQKLHDAVKQINQEIDIEYMMKSYRTYTEENVSSIVFDAVKGMS
jgi:hypothetical protein